MPDATEPTPNLGGRPLKFQTVEELDLAIQNYFAEQDPHTTTALVETGRDSKGNLLFDTRTVLTEQKPYTMSGLALALGITRQTLLDHAAKDGFSDSIRMAKQRCEAYAESQLYGPFANGAKFNLINNYQGKYQPWSDKQAIDHTSAGKRIESPAIYMSKIEPRNDDAPAEAEAS